MRKATRYYYKDQPLKECADSFEHPDSSFIFVIFNYATAWINFDKDRVIITGTTWLFPDDTMS